MSIDRLIEDHPVVLIVDLSMYCGMLSFVLTITFLAYVAYSACVYKKPITSHFRFWP